MWPVRVQKDVLGHTRSKSLLFMSIAYLGAQLWPFLCCNLSPSSPLNICKGGTNHNKLQRLDITTLCDHCSQYVLLYPWSYSIIRTWFLRELTILLRTWPTSYWSNPHPYLHSSNGMIPSYHRVVTFCGWSLSGTLQNRNYHMTIIIAMSHFMENQENPWKNKV